MLKPSSDRLDYGELLTPPPDFELDAAVGTTYSLDLDALVGVSLALGLSQSTESSLINNPIYLLESLRRTGNRVALFCQLGQIQVPSNKSALYILLEKIVFEVQVKKQAKPPQYPAFHPKFWLIRYKNAQGRALYRVVILSRNLTFDRSWDVAVSLEGEVQKRPAVKSKPVADFLTYLLSSLSGSNENVRAKRKLLRELIGEVEYVEFSTSSREFTDYEFVPVGIPGESAVRIREIPLFKKSETFHEVLVMSPFLSASVIDELNSRNKNIVPRCTLITRRSSLELLKPKQCDRFELYTMKDAVVEGESALSEEGVGAQKQDIHAKLYMWRKNSASELYLGSLNASHSAMSGNVEFMLRLMSSNRWLNLDTLKKNLFGGVADDPANPFELTELPTYSSAVSEIQSVLENKIKLLCRTNPTASVRADGDKYAIEVSFGKLPDTEGLTLAPLLSVKQALITQTVTFKGLSLLNISEFYRVIAQNEEGHVERVVKIPTADIPPERERAVVTDTIRDRRGFYQYVAFLLGDDYLLSALEHTTIQHSAFVGHSEADIPVLYERMLRASVATPERFDDIDYLVNMINADGVIPEQFTELYNEFKKAVKQRG